jgi:hypothetical protein
MNIAAIIENICKVENPYSFEIGVWSEDLEGFLITNEAAEENAAYIGFEECRDAILLMVTN